MARRGALQHRTPGPSTLPASHYPVSGAAPANIAVSPSSSVAHGTESWEGPSGPLPALISRFSHSTQDKEAAYHAEKYLTNMWLHGLALGRERCTRPESFQHPVTC